MSITSRKQEFINKSKKFDFNNFFPILHAPEDEEFFSFKLHSEFFDISRFKYPKDPIKLMEKVEKKDRYVCPEGNFTPRGEHSQLGLSEQEQYLIQRDWLFEPWFLLQFCDNYALLKCLKYNKNASKQASYTSYKWKHITEHIVGRYVMNGAAIAAAIALDIPSLNTGELNPYLGVSAKSEKIASKYAQYVIREASGQYNSIYERYNCYLWRSDERLQKKADTQQIVS